MAANGTVRQCEVCGEEFSERDMMSFSSGRKRHWLCWGCYKLSQYEAGKNEARRTKAIEKSKAHLK